jgi:iron complex transport system permease protein
LNDHTPPVARRPAVLAGLGLLLVVLFIAALALGAIRLPTASLWLGLTGRGEELEAVERTVLYSLRLPRALGAVLVGGVLGLCGAALQGLFRNPLADPGLIGVTAGAALGAALALTYAAAALGGVSIFLGQLSLPVFALAGALGATALMHRLSIVEGRVVVALMLLAGVGLNALAGAGVGLVLFFADDEQLRQFTFWTLGSLGQVTWPKLAAALPFVLPALVLVPGLARSLDALLLGESEAGHLGVDLARLKRRLILCTAAAVGAAVSIAGGIGFIGLVVPHLVRMMVGPGHRLLLPASALLGAALLLGADLAARTIALPAELPVGVLTAALGAPVFFSLLRRGRRSRAF